MKKRTMLFEEFGRDYNTRMLLEGLKSDSKDVEAEVADVKKELEEEGLDADDTEIKAQVLLQAIEHDGDLDKIDFAKVKSDVKEHIRSKGATDKPGELPINESAGPLLHLTELIGNLAGNADLMHFILKLVEKASGKKFEYVDAKNKIEKIVGVLKTVSSGPAVILIKTFDWVAEKFGVSSVGGKKAISMVGRVGVLLFLFVLGCIHFPVLGGGLFMWVLSLTALIGKSVEMVHIGHEFVELLKKPEEFKDQTGMSVDDVEEMIA